MGDRGKRRGRKISLLKLTGITFCENLTTIVRWFPENQVARISNVESVSGSTPKILVRRQRL